MQLGHERLDGRKEVGWGSWPGVTVDGGGGKGFNEWERKMRAGPLGGRGASEGLTERRTEKPHQVRKEEGK